MSETIVEHNDVDIRPLFAWSKEFEIVDGERKTPVFMRLLGDADMNRARVSALRRSAELRRKLKDFDSDERLAYIRDIDEVDMIALVAVITVFSMRDLTDKAIPKLKIKSPKPPRSDAKTEAHEKFQTEIDSYPNRRRSELKKLLEKEVEDLNKELSSQSKEDVYKKYVSCMVDELCERELTTAFKEWCSYLGSFSDETLTNKIFVSFDEFNNLPSALKDNFISEYSSLELYGEDLKKLRQVTP